MTISPLDAYVRLAGTFDCLTSWDQTITDLEPAAGLIDLDAIARALCVLDATIRAVLRQLEQTMVAPDEMHHHMEVAG